MRATRPLRGLGPAGLLAAAALVCLPAPAVLGQERRAPQWTVGLESGVHFPTTLYSEWIRGILTVDGFDITTRYRERTDPAFPARLVLRYRPESGMGFFGGVQRLSASTTAYFHGGGSPPDSIPRRVEIWIVEAGTSLRMARFGRGGLVAYSLGPVYVHQTLDLTLGHRNVLAEVGGGSRHDVEWRPRSWGSVGLSLAASVRVPLTSALALRLTAQEYVVPVDKAELQEKERRAVFQLTGRAPVFNYNPYTAHYPSARVGLEYTLRREPAPPPPPLVRMLAPEGPDTVARPRVLAARAALAQGDTAEALGGYRAALAEEAADPVAARELALLLAAMAERRPLLRPDAVVAIERALALNPGHPALLVAVGHVRALGLRAGERVTRAEPLEVGGLSGVMDEAGGVSLSFIVRNLTPDDDGQARYRAEIDLTGPDGVRVPLEPRGEGGEVAELVTLERAVAAEPQLPVRLELRLLRVRPGPHTVRVRVFDRVSGAVAQAEVGVR